MANKRNNRPELSREEKHRRIDDIGAIVEGAETPETIMKKWAARGMPLSIRQVKEYYNRLKPRFERGDDLHDLVENHTWSDVIWPPSLRKPRKR